MDIFFINPKRNKTETEYYKSSPMFLQYTERGSLCVPRDGGREHQATLSDVYRIGLCTFQAIVGL